MVKEGTHSLRRRATALSAVVWILVVAWRFGSFDAGGGLEIELVEHVRGRDGRARAEVAFRLVNRSSDDLTVGSIEVP